MSAVWETTTRCTRAAGGCVLQDCLGGILCYRLGDSRGMITVFLTAIPARLPEVSGYFLPHGSILHLSSPAVPSSGRCDYTPPVTATVYYERCCTAVIEMLHRELFTHPLLVKDNKNLFDWALGSHSLLDTRNTDLGSWLSLATSNTMFMSCWPCEYMGQL